MVLKATAEFKTSCFSDKASHEDLAICRKKATGCSGRPLLPFFVPTNKFTKCPRLHLSLHRTVHCCCNRKPITCDFWPPASVGVPPFGECWAVACRANGPVGALALQSCDLEMVRRSHNWPRRCRRHTSQSRRTRRNLARSGHSGTGAGVPGRANHSQAARPIHRRSHGSCRRSCPSGCTGHCYRCAERWDRELCNWPRRFHPSSQQIHYSGDQVVGMKCCYYSEIRRFRIRSCTRPSCHSS